MTDRKPLLSTLRALEQAATKGQWECELRSVKQPHGEAARTLGSVRVKGALPVKVVVRLDFGYGSDSDAATAALIVALRNAAPALLGVVSFVEELAGETCAYDDNCPPFGTRHGKCMSCKARSALASLEKSA